MEGLLLFSAAKSLYLFLRLRKGKPPHLSLFRSKQVSKAVQH